MTGLTPAPTPGRPDLDPRYLEAGGFLGPPPGLGFSNQWSSSPYITSSDRQVSRNGLAVAADAKDATRSNPYAKSALRSSQDAVIGARFNLSLQPDWQALGVTSDEAAIWAEMVEELWDVEANSVYCHMDAQRKQTFTGLMRTAYDSYYAAGEVLGTIEWKTPIVSACKTCLYLIAPERLSDPNAVPVFNSKRRMGVERDKHGAPVAYHIREAHPADIAFYILKEAYTWRRVPRYSRIGRLNVIHYYEQDQPDMTRGLSQFTTATMSMRLLQDYMTTELESAAVRATYAAVIESELDYEKAMEVIGDTHKDALRGNPVLEFETKAMMERLTYYRGQDVRFGKSKVAHLLPNESLKMVQGSQSASALKDFNDAQLYSFASALGVDYSTLTKDFSSVNYSGARAALFDVWRSYEVRRQSFIDSVAMPFFACWLEEKIVLGRIPMLGKGSFYECFDSVVRGNFETWSKPMLDPQKEVIAQKTLYELGALSLKDICGADGRDWRRVMDERARQKTYMTRLGLKPEDIDWDLLPSVPKPPGQGGSASGGSSGDSGGTGSSN